MILDKCRLPPFSAWIKNKQTNKPTKNFPRAGKRYLRIKNNLQTSIQWEYSTVYSGWNLFIDFEVEEWAIKETQVRKTRERLMCLQGTNLDTLEGILALSGFKDAHLKHQRQIYLMVTFRCGKKNNAFSNVTIIQGQ